MTVSEISLGRRGAADCTHCGECLYLTRTYYWRHVLVDRSHDAVPTNRVYGEEASAKIDAAFEERE